MTNKKENRPSLIAVTSFFVVFALLKFTPLNAMTPNLLLLVLVLLIYGLGFGWAVYQSKNVLAVQWRDFKSRKWTKYLWIVATYIAVVLVISILRKLSNSWFAADTQSPATQEVVVPVLYTVLGSLIPLMAPLYEELVFRHGLFYTRVKSSFSLVLCALISSVLFGLIHYYNFGNALATVPYMFVGLFFCAVYWKTKNIFFVIFPHLLLNGLNILLGLLSLVFLKFI